jgi:4-alpha-glucanotransferase
MIPKKSKKYINTVSKDLEVNEQLVDDLVDFYYSECRTIMSNLKCTRLNIDGLGHFVSRHNLVKKAIDRCTKALNNHDTSTFAAYYNKKSLENKLELLNNLTVLHEEERQRKIQFKETKNELKKDLGE